MDIRIICVGDELLSGDTVNTNLAFLGDRLAQIGLAISEEHCVPDSEEAILRALSLCRGADLVFVMGGLGPTRDDLTRPTVAKFLGRNLSLDADVRAGIQAYLGLRARTLPSDALDIQSQVPTGATVIPNRNGTAPGLLLQEDSSRWILLPGPPREMGPMVDNEVVPMLRQQAADWDAVTLHVCCRPESRVEKTVHEVLGDKHGLHLAFCIKHDNIMVRVSKRRSDGNSGELPAAVAALRRTFGGLLLPDDCPSAAAYLGRLLRERGLVMATAESCTGGGIAAALTDIPGSSEWFAGAVVTYANEWKTRLLGVPAETIAKHGAVSEETVQAMLSGLVANYGVPVGIAVSGIAGPGGGTAEKPVGTVVVGAIGPGWREVRSMHFNGLRDTVRMRSANAGMNLLIEHLLENNSAG
ncbi:MAG: CinA family nicotinamide mononucleotide deamidase-related protein [Lentisphaeria bacterium]|jgi:nicotinamide-nucleotide amidase